MNVVDSVDSGVADDAVRVLMKMSTQVSRCG